MSGRKCSICHHEKCAAINSAVAKGVSFRDIAGQYDIASSSVGRHAENCLKLSLQAVLKENKERQAVDVIDQFTKLLDRGLKATEAAESCLLVDGDLTFNPRAWEMDVVYEDLLDRTKEGNPKVKTRSLADLLAMVQGKADKIPLHTYVKIQDARKTYNETLGRLESLGDKFAKLQGAYQQPKANDVDLQSTAKAIRDSITHYQFVHGRLPDDETLRELVKEVAGAKAEDVMPMVEARTGLEG